MPSQRESLRRRRAWKLACSAHVALALAALAACQAPRRNAAPETILALLAITGILIGASLVCRARLLASLLPTAPDRHRNGIRHRTVLLEVAWGLDVTIAGAAVAFVLAGAPLVALLLFLSAMALLLATPPKIAPDVE